MCETEKRIPASSLSTRASTVVLPAPDGAETTITVGRRSLNVLHLLAEALDLRLQRHDGADTFVGGRASDSVSAGEQGRVVDGDWIAGVDTEKDTIDAGEGNDSVVSGSAGAANSDVVTLGLGGDYLRLGASSVTSGATLDGGAGEDGLYLTGGSGDLTLDMTQGTFTSPQGTARFTGFDFTSLDVGTGKVTYRGTEGDDYGHAAAHRRRTDPRRHHRWR